MGTTAKVDGSVVGVGAGTVGVDEAEFEQLEVSSTRLTINEVERLKMNFMFTLFSMMVYFYVDLAQIILSPIYSKKWISMRKNLLKQ